MSNDASRASQAHAYRSPMMSDSDLCFFDATELARLLRTSEVSSREVVAAHIAQVERVNPAGERDRHVRPGAGHESRGRSGRAAHPARGSRPAARAAGGPQGPARHRASARRTVRRSYADYVPDADCVAVARIKAAGGNHHRQDEHAGIRAGLSDIQRGVRRDRNPYDTSKTCGGSSRRSGRGPRVRHGPDRRWLAIWAVRYATRRTSTTWSAFVVRQGECRGPPGSWATLSVDGQWPGRSMTWPCC